MKIIDGKLIAASIRNELKEEVIKMGITPSLAILMIGANSANEIYVNNKLKASAEIGINTKIFRFDESSNEEDIIRCIKELNNNESIHGIIIQSPVSKKFNEDYLNSFIDPAKDVDGFGVYNMGCLATNNPKFLAATPKGIIKLLETEGLPISGQNVVIVGRSKIVGRPLALALLNKDATVTITHRKTKNLASITSQADILIVAIGCPNFITKDYVKDGAVVIDVGINKLNDKLYGDVDNASVSSKVSYITPVPGGVGPMTVASLLANVVESAKIHSRKEEN